MPFHLRRIFKFVIGLDRSIIIHPHLCRADNSRISIGCNYSGLASSGRFSHTPAHIHVLNRSVSRKGKRHFKGFIMEPRAVVSSAIPIVQNGHQSTIANVNKSDTNCQPDDDKSKIDYECAVNELQNLISNAEAVARAVKNRAQRRLVVIPNMNHFVLRAGLTEQDVDNLSIIHVSGTKGKGSTCAFVESILRAKGYKTGLFSSPHLIEVRERIRINGRPISRDLFVKNFWQVYSRLRATQKNDGDMPAYFAFHVLMGLHVFKSEGVDVIITEVGIGGEYDSTNFIRHPVVCGVTSLGLDHTSVLGNTVEEIAWHKAGIFKNGRPALSVFQNPSCIEVLLAKAKERQSPLHLVPELAQELITKGGSQLGIPCRRQFVNASLAVQLARTWESSRSNKETLPCNVDAVTAVKDIPTLGVKELTAEEIKGLTSCVWPGRAQTVKRPGITYYLDGAHTRESMEVCSQWFAQASEVERKSTRGKVVQILLFNMTGDRHATTLLPIIQNSCDFNAAVFCTNFISTVAEHNPKDHAMKAVTQSEMFRKAEAIRVLWDELVSTPGGEESAVVNDNNNSSCSCPHPDDPSATKSNGSVNNNNITNAMTTATTALKFSSPVVNGSGDNNGGDCHHSPSPSKIAKHSTSPVISQTSAEPVIIVSELQVDMPVGRCHANASTSSPLSSPSASSSLSSSSVPLSQQKHDRDSHAAQMVQSCGDGCVQKAKTASRQPSPPVVISHALPCVLQALAWATQSRDPGVSVKDPLASLPEVPACLRDADHIQVLVTGSLHLVGAALTVVDPHMNDS